jgi:hypothetical protein
MLGTNRQYEAALESLERQIPRIEAALLRQDSSPNLASGLADLWARRRILKLLMLNRRVEAAKRVVDFRRWRDGNGALYLLAERGAAAPIELARDGAASL